MQKGIAASIFLSATKNGVLIMTQYFQSTVPTPQAEENLYAG